MKLRLHDNQSFQIIQITDLHFKDFPWNEADLKTFKAIEKMVFNYEPDLLIFTGDIMWATLSNHPMESYQQFIEFCNSLNVPVAITYGNHDTNHPDVTRQILRQLENDLQQPVDKQHSMIVEDRESYVIEIYDYSQTKVHYALYFLDSGGYNNRYGGRYDWILPEQINWFNQRSKEHEQLKTVKEIIVFQHIPLPEYLEAYYQEKPRNAVKEQHFRVDTPSINTGFFANLVINPLATTLFVGHNHNNNFDVHYRNLRMVFGQVSGFGANALAKRGARLIRLTPKGIQTEIIEF